MSSSYIDQLLSIRGLLNSPFSEIVKDGYDMLFELLIENENNPNFVEDIEQLTREYPSLSQELEVRRQKAERKAAPIDLVELKKVDDTVKTSYLLPKKIFISYAHKDEKFKNELVMMLMPLQNHGVIEIWQDRRIEEGEEWYQAIKNAMTTCDLALLLVSKHFLASSFISREELPNLLQRRKEQGLRIVPIIISECLWQSVPVLRDLQALPKDGKPIVSFKGTGGRDIVWTEIAKTIEKRAKKLREED
jgi:hypothetical protein